MSDQTDSLESLVFLKLGGSLITEKHKPRTPRLITIQRICQEIAHVIAKNPQLKILLGHGSGSYGHTSGSIYHTRDGVKTKNDWIGFSEVWRDASSLNQIILDHLQDEGLPVIVFPPSSGITTQQRIITNWNWEPILSALNNGLVPLVYGDVVFDTKIGGTILSTEELFVFLAQQIQPNRILLAGRDPGVWKDYPECTTLLTEITPEDLPYLGEKIRHAETPDVTGGMQTKVKQMLTLVQRLPNLEVVIFSGEEKGSIHSILSGKPGGTTLHS